MKGLLLLSCTMLAFSANATENYCHDTDKNENWEKLIRQFPEDTVILRLYALRRGLCVMIDEGTVNLEKAIDLFEIERDRGIRERNLEELNLGSKHKVSYETFD
jgi:hypothetical protein